VDVFIVVASILDLTYYDCIIMLLSNITLCSSRVQFITKTFESVIEQDDPNIDHIIVDGGSTDGSQNAYERDGWDILDATVIR
jgi:GT2 family glycosyltransferase